MRIYKIIIVYVVLDGWQTWIFGAKSDEVTGEWRKFLND
jgi:hypothetical protein